LLGLLQYFTVCKIFSLVFLLVILVLFSGRCAQEEPLEKRGEEEEGEEEREGRRREQDQRKATIAQILISMGANVNARNGDGHTANEGLVRIQYKCRVPIYVFPEMKLLFPKQNYNVLSPSSYTHIYVRDRFICFQD
jgi:hypothetical protein